MRIATMRTTQRRFAAGLVALVIVVANLLPGSVASVQARPQTREFYCAGAAQHAVACTFFGGNTGAGRIKILISNHANGGEVCHLKNGVTGSQASEDVWVDVRYIHSTYEYTFRPYFAQPTPLDLWCMRRWTRGDAGIGGHIIYP